MASNLQLDRSTMLYDGTSYGARLFSSKVDCCGYCILILFSYMPLVNKSFCLRDPNQECIVFFSESNLFFAVEYGKSVSFLGL